MTKTAAVLDSHWTDLEGWSSSSVAPSKQFNWWRDFVVDAHLFWDIKPLPCDRFPAFLRQGRFDGHRLIHLTAACGGVKGRRSRHELAKDGEEFYTLLYVAEGKLGLDFGSHQILLEPGAFAMFDTTKPMGFDVIEQLREISFSVPKARFEHAMPRPEEYCGRAMRSTFGISKLFIDCLLALEANFGGLSSREANEAINFTTETMIATLSSKVELPIDSSYRKQLQYVMDSINRQIGNPCLTPRRVAHDAGLSERQLFRLFSAVGTTPAAWIRKRRLDRCRQDLLSQSCAHLSVLEVAAQWGFIDASVFSRCFRREFGVSPRQMRISAKTES